MSKTLQEIFKIIQTTLIGEGFKIGIPEISSYSSCHFILEEDLKNENGVISGISLLVEKVESKTKDVINYKLKIIDWKNSGQKEVDSIKISSTATDKTIVKKIKQFINTYKLYRQYKSL